MSTTKISMFSSSNDTDKWAVCVDGFYGLFDSEDEATAAYESIGGYDGSDGLGDTPFGSAQMLPPQSLITREPWGGWSQHTRLSDHLPIDIANYIRRNWQKWGQHYNREWTPAQKRIADARELAQLFGNSINLGELATIW